MSASTVSVTANPRRRTGGVVINDMKQNIDIVNDPTTTPNDDSNKNKDLSHSIRGEAVLERSSKETGSGPVRRAQLPTTSNAPTTRARSRRPASGGGAPSRPARPRWVTVLSVLTKNFLLVLVLLGLFQMVRKLVVVNNSHGGEGSASLVGLSDMEGRIASVESLMKTTAKMLQVEVDAVDKKVAALVGDVRKRVEEMGAETNSKMRDFEGRAVVLEAALGELKSKELLTKEDLGKLYEELKKAGGKMGSELGLDEIRALAREIVEKEIEKHAADGLGKVDYALASGGARVVKHSDPFVVGKMGSLFSLGNSKQVHIDAEKMLRPSFGEPGQCFPLKGSSGFVQIRLRTAIVPEAITLEHLSKSVAYDRSSAPNHCRVSGWRQGGQGPQGLDTELAIDNEQMVLLTEFTYDLEKSNAQTFDVLDSATSAVIDTVRFEFSSNHGSPTHTCIYRLRVHGHEPHSIQMIAADS